VLEPAGSERCGFIEREQFKKSFAKNFRNKDEFFDGSSLSPMDSGLTSVDATQHNERGNIL